MRTTIDAAGRVVVPEQLRKAAHLAAGQELEIVERDGRIEIEPVSSSIALVERDGFLAAESDDGAGGSGSEGGDTAEPLTAERVRDILERTRR